MLSLHKDRQSNFLLFPYSKSKEVTSFLYLKVHPQYPQSLSIPGVGGQFPEWKRSCLFRGELRVRAPTFCEGLQVGQVRRVRTGPSQIAWGGQGRTDLPADRLTPTMRTGSTSPSYSLCFLCWGWVRREVSRNWAVGGSSSSGRSSGSSHSQTLRVAGEEAPLPVLATFQGVCFPSCCARMPQAESLHPRRHRQAIPKATMGSCAVSWREI